MATWLAVKIRNQCRMVVNYHLSEGASFQKSGESWLLKQIAPRMSNFIDIGANVGNWTCIFLQYAPRHCKGILFEPSTNAFELLTRRLGKIKEIEIVQAALSDKGGEAAFFELPDAQEGSSMILSGNTLNPEFAIGFRQNVSKIVRVATLDDEVEKRGWRHVDYVKIDAEGYDFHILQGAHKLLKEKRISLIQFEYTDAWMAAGSTLLRAINFLNTFGYKVFLLRPGGLYEFAHRIYGEYFGYSNFIAMLPETIEYSGIKIKRDIN